MTQTEAKISLETQKKRIILYVGLEKCASTFFRCVVFPSLDSSKILASYLPFRPFKEIAASGEYTEETLAKCRKLVEDELAEISQDTVIVYSMSLSFSLGDPDCGLENFVERTEFLSKIFPDAEVVLVVRNQTDWLVSQYKEAISRGVTLSFPDFLNFRNGALSEKAQDVPDSVDVRNLDLCVMYECYIRCFGEENVHLMFYENLRENQQLFIEKYTKTLGLTLAKEVQSGIVNRGYSVLSLTIILHINRFYKMLGLSPLGQNTRKSPLIMWLGSVIDRLQPYDFLDTSFSSAFKQIPAAHVPLFLMRRLLLKLVAFSQTKRAIQTIYDRLIYVDWNIAPPELRHEIKKYYSEKNRGLSQILEVRGVTDHYISIC